MSSAIIDWFTTTNVTVAPVINLSAGFGVAAHVADAVTFGSSGDKYRMYSTSAGIATDLAASEITAAAAAALNAMLAAVPRPASVALIKVTVSTPQTYTAAIEAAMTAGLRFVHLTIDSRTASDQVEISDWAESKRVIFYCQTNVVSPPISGWTSILDNSGTVPVYHPTATEWADAELSARISAIDPAIRCTSFRGVLNDPTAYDITESQSAALRAAFVNTLEPYTHITNPRAYGPGYALSGEFAYVRLTKIYAETKIDETIIQLLVDYDADNGRKIPESNVGEQIVLGRVAAVLDALVGSEHLKRSATYPDGYTLAVSISPTTHTLTVTGAALVLDALVKINTNLNLVRGV